MKGIKITAMLLIICQAVIAQTKSVDKITTRKMEKLESTITMTDTQKASIESVVRQSAYKVVALRDSTAQDKKEIGKIRKEERAQIRELLTEEQRDQLKDAKQVQRKNREGQLKNNKERGTHREVLRAKRLEFDKILSEEEKSKIEEARALLPERSHKKEHVELTEAQKEERKTIRKTIAILLQPIIENHKTELDAIKAELPAKPARADKPATDRKGNRAEYFYHRFLLMK